MQILQFHRILRIFWCHDHPKAVDSTSLALSCGHTATNEGTEEQEGEDSRGRGGRTEGSRGEVGQRRRWRRGGSRGRGGEVGTEEEMEEEGGEQREGRGAKGR
jgi:hypothetical protein